MNSHLFSRLVAVVVVLTAWTVGAQTVTLRYNPPTGTAWIRTTQRFISEKSKEGALPAVSERTVYRFKIQECEGGFCWEETMVKQESTRNGKPFDNPATSILVGRTNITQTSKSGEVLDMRGNKDLIQEMKKILPQSHHGTIEATLNAKAMLEMEKRLWDRRFKRFAGRTVKEGDVWMQTFRSGSTQAPDPDQQFVLTRVHKIAQLNGRTLVTFIYAVSAQPGEVDNLDLSQSTATLRDKFLLSPATRGLGFLRMLGSSVFDAETLLLRKDECVLYDMFNGVSGPVARNETRIETCDPETP